MNRIRKAFTSITRFSSRLGGINGLLTYLKIALFKRLPGPRQRVITVRVPQAQTRVHLRPKTTDAHAFWQVFIEGDYDFPISRKPQVIVDAGAHVGFATLYFLHRFPEARFVAIEPEASNADIFAANTAAYKNVHLHRAALWKDHKALNIKNPGADSWSFRVEEPDNDAGGIDAVTIQDILGENGYIDILKLDIEGAEMQLFSGDTAWLKQVGLVILEFHERYAPGSTGMIHGIMNDHGFSKLFEQGENVIFQAPANQAA